MVTVVSNSSPLITLARIGHLNLLQHLFGRIHIAREVWVEVVERGAGRPAAEAVSKAGWIDIHPPAKENELAVLRRRQALGTGELATVLLAQTIPADLAIIDERAARRLAQSEGLVIMGCVGLLERGHRLNFVPDLRETYSNLLEQGIRVDRQILNQSLASLELPPL